MKDCTGIIPKEYFIHFSRKNAITFEDALNKIHKEILAFGVWIIEASFCQTSKRPCLFSTNDQNYS